MEKGSAQLTRMPGICGLVEKVPEATWAHQIMGTTVCFKIRSLKENTQEKAEAISDLFDVSHANAYNWFS